MSHDYSEAMFGLFGLFYCSLSGWWVERGHLPLHQGTQKGIICAEATKPAGASKSAIKCPQISRCSREPVKRRTWKWTTSWTDPEKLVSSKTHLSRCLLVEFWIQWPAPPVVYFAGCEKVRFPLPKPMERAPATTGYQTCKANRGHGKAKSQPYPLLMRVSER